MYSMNWSEEVRVQKFQSSLTYFYLPFLLNDSLDSMGRVRTIFILLYYFYSLTNI